MPIHIVHIMANENTAPYLNWFAEWSVNDKDVKFSFINLYSSKPQMIDDVKKYECDCFWIPYNSSNKKKDFLKVSYKLFKLLKKIKPDVVNSHLFEDSLLSLWIARILGVKKRFVTKGDTAYHYFHTPKMVWFDRFINWNATHIIAPSSESMEFILEKEKANPRKVHLIHHGINFSEMAASTESGKDELNKRFKIKDQKVIGTVCRYIKWKGYLELIEAVKLVVLKHPTSLFLFVGEGPQRPELELKIKEKKLENNIILTGWIPKELIPSLYSILDVYVHPAHFEPFGFVVPEAALNNIPIVSTPTGSARDLIKDSCNGILVPYNDINKMSDGILYMLENNTSNYIKSAFEFTQKYFNFDVMYSNYKKHYLM